MPKELIVLTIVALVIAAGIYLGGRKSGSSGGHGRGSQPSDPKIRDEE